MTSVRAIARALPLPARKVLTALSDQGIILFRQGFNALSYPGFDRLLPNLVEQRICTGE
ncbi:hypothetical protein H6F61_24165 [Cyanobacteria bacterium FACHB-472]|nr:hypothetical protein [Cyanobacteria bacterium FACHB-472]